MKKALLFFAFAILSVTFINAQETEEETEDLSTYSFSKGDVYISGSINYRKQKRETSERSDTRFGSSVGYFVSDHFAINAGLILGSINSESASNLTEASTFGWSIGASYVFTPEHRFSFILDFNAGSEKTDVESTTVNDYYFKQFRMEISPKINYFLSEKFALQISLGALSYADNQNNINIQDAFESTNTGLNLNLSNVSLGAIYKF